MASSLTPISGVPCSRLFCSPSSQSFQDNGYATTAQLGSPSTFYVIPAASTSNQGSSQNPDPASLAWQIMCQVATSAIIGFGLLLGIAGLASLFSKGTLSTPRENKTAMNTEIPELSQQPA